jgi:hypothetical protein
MKRKIWLIAMTLVLGVAAAPWPSAADVARPVCCDPEEEDCRCRFVSDCFAWINCTVCRAIAPDEEYGICE